MPPVATVIRAAAATCVAVTTCGALAGCGVPPELRPKPGSSVPRPSPVASQPDPPLSPGALPPFGDDGNPSPARTFAEGVAVPCNGHPSKDEVIALVRRSGGLLPRTGNVAVVKEPYCAGTWQYTVFAVPGKEPLQVVSRGTPDSLRLVTAGTDICSIEVRTSGPPGIRDAALCPPIGT